MHVCWGFSHDSRRKYPFLLEKTPFNRSQLNGFHILLKSLDTDGKTAEGNHYTDSFFQHGCVLGLPQFRGKNCTTKPKEHSKQITFCKNTTKGKNASFSRTWWFLRSIVNHGGKGGYREATRRPTATLQELQSALTLIHWWEQVHETQIGIKVHKSGLCRSVARGNSLIKGGERRHIPSCLESAQRHAWCATVRSGLLTFQLQCAAET